MKRSIVVASVCAAAIVVACGENPIASGTGSITLRVLPVETAPPASESAATAGEAPRVMATGHLDGARVRVSGPTNKVVALTPTSSGFTGTVDGLAPGSYTVVVEGLVSGAVDYVGRTSGVQVAAGKTTSATITNFGPFHASDLTARPVSLSQIDLSWTDDASAEDGFRIERCTGAGCTTFAQIATVGPNVVAYANTGLPSGTNYSYRVLAYNGSTTSAYSNAAPSTTPFLLQNSVAESNLTAASGGELYFALQVPPGQSQLTVELSGGTGNADLYVRFGSVPTLADWDCRPLSSDNSEKCSVATPQAGDWYVVLHGAAAFSGVSLSGGYATTPPAPSALTATAVSATQIDLAWTDNSNNEDGFRIERCGGPGCTTFTEIATVGPNVTTYQNTGLTAGTGYSYQVRAYNFAGNSVYSNAAIVPAAPTGLVATPASGTQINLTWADNATNEDGFRIERCAGTGCTAFAQVASVAANVTAYQNTGLTPGTTYGYRVRAYTAAGSSDYTTPASATPPTVPAAPTGLTATATSGTEIDLAWTDNATNEDGYRIERCQGVGCTSFVEIATVAANTTTYQNTGLTPGTSYSYRVRAYNLAGNSLYSNAPSATPPNMPVPPTRLTASGISGTQIDLAWFDNSNNESGFRIERCAGGGCAAWVEIATVGPNANTYQNTGLTAGVGYSYRVRAYNPAGTSDYSNAAVVPVAPTTLTTTSAGATEIDLAWLDNASDEDGFRIEQCQGVNCTAFAEIATVGPNVTAYESRFLAAGASYSYRVRAYTATGTSEYSNIAAGVTPLPSPSALTAGAVSVGQINLAWFDNASNEDGYRIERCSGAGCATFAEIATVGPNVTAYANTGVTAGTGYSYRVRAYNAVGSSGYSNVAVVAVAPTNLTATAVSGSEIDLAWTDNATDEDGFRIEYCLGVGCTAFSEIATVGPNVTSYQSSFVASGTSYSFRVRAFTATGTSAYSNPATAATPLPQPTNLTASAVSGTQINLAWVDNSFNEDGFRIEQCTGPACTTFVEIATAGPNVTTYANPGLTPGTGYSYRVRAYNVTGNSGYSNVAAVPVAPTGLTATTVSGTEIDLAWTDNATDEDGFRIDYCTGPGCTTFSEVATVGANVTTYQSLFVGPGTSYSFRVRAHTAAGTSAYSNTATAVTPLPPPTNLTATAVSSTQINLTWADNSFNEDGFRIERCGGAGCTTFAEIATVGPNVSTYASTGLTPGTGYSYRVRAYNVTGNSGYSTVAVVPVAPTNLTATTVSGTEIDLAWTDNATDEDGFRIEYCTGVGCTAFSEIATVGANVTSYQHFSPPAGASHSYRVRAYTVTGTSVYSNTATAVIPLPAPASLTATAVSGVQINLAWADNSFNEDGFRIERCGGAECTTFAEIATVGPNVTTYASTGLTPGTGYSYRVRAYNVTGTSPYSNTAVVPVAPSNLTATTVSGTEIDLAWTDNATDEDGFRIEYCAGVGCTTFSEVATVGANVTTYQSLFVTPGTSYSFRVRAHTVAGTSVYSNTATGVTPLPAPTNLTASAVSTTQINLQWADNSFNEDGFRIERCNGVGCTTFAVIATVGPNVTTYANTGLVTATSYSYRVRAYNAAGTSAYSNTATASNMLPLAPTNLTATTVSASEIDLAWTDHATNEDGFRIERCAGTGCTIFTEIATVGADVTTYQNTGLTANTSYTYQVRAYNAAGTSAYTNPATATTIPPAAPTSLVATGVSGSQISLAWQDNATTEDGFRIERCEGDACGSFAEITTVPANVTTYQDPSLTLGTSYSYRVRAYNAAGPSSYSNPATAVPHDQAAPTSLTATTVSGNQIDLAWTDNSDNEGGFRIEWCSGVGCTTFVEVATVGANVTTYQKAVALNFSYSFRVRAYNVAGTSAYSNVATTTTILPFAPTNLTATTASSSQIDLAWTDNATTEDGFRIERCAGGGCTSFTEIATVGANVTTYQNTGLTANTSYNYRVRAYNGTGTSAYSNTATATTIPPAAPASLAATGVSASQISLAWQDNATTEDGFRIERCTGVGCTTFAEITTVAANVTTYQDPGLTLGTSYSYRVRAYNAAGPSGYSNTATAVPHDQAAPTNLTATTVSGNQIDLAWTDNSDNEGGFRIEWCSGVGCTNFVEVATVGANVTTYQKAVALNFSYSFRVRAYNVAGTSAYSNVATTTTILPFAPTNLTATTASSSQIDLAWTDNATTEDGFRIERCAGGGCTSFTEIATVAANVTTYPNTGLTANTSYSYRVRAYNGAGTSAYSNTATATTPTCNCWTTRASMPTPRSLLAAGVVNGMLYAVGGYIAGALGTVEAYDPISDTWRTKAPLPTARYGLGVGVVNGILYAVGGRDFSAIGALEAYDPITDTWTSKASMPTARYYVGTGVVNGILYAIGGADANGGVVGTVEAYNPATDTWTTKASLPTARSRVAVGVVNGILYAVGGLSAANTALVVVDAYDPATDTWTRKASMPTARGWLAVDVVNGMLYAVGGYSPDILATVEAYDPATDAWTAKPSMPTARYGLAAGVINGMLCAVGGSSSASVLATLESYQP